jgi:hypothetical protein
MNSFIAFCQHVYDKGDGFGLIVALLIVCGAFTASVDSVTRIFRQPKRRDFDKEKS